MTGMQGGSVCDAILITIFANGNGAVLCAVNAITFDPERIASRDNALTYILTRSVIIFNIYEI